MCIQVLDEQDDTPSGDELVETSANQELDKSPSAALRVQEAILKELTNEDVHKVHSCVSNFHVRGLDQIFVIELSGD